MASHTKLTIKELPDRAKQLWITLYDKNRREIDKKRFGPLINQTPLPSTLPFVFYMRHSGRLGYFTISCFDLIGRQIFMQTKTLKKS
jgi:hypothetical protein